MRKIWNMAMSVGRWLLIWGVITFAVALIEKKFDSSSVLAGVIVSIIVTVLSELYRKYGVGTE